MNYLRGIKAITYEQSTQKSSDKLTITYEFIKKRILILITHTCMHTGIFYSFSYRVLSIGYKNVPSGTQQTRTLYAMVYIFYRTKERKT